MNKKVIRNIEKHTKKLGKIGLTITNLLEHDNIYYYEINIKDINTICKVDDLDIIINNKQTLMLYSILKYCSKKYNDNTITIEDDYLKELLGVTKGNLIDIKNDLSKTDVVNISNDTYIVLDNIELTDYVKYEINEKYHVYRFINKEGEIIYIGRTTSMKNRMSQHFGSNSHLPQQVYDELNKIEYTTLNSEVLMAMCEIYEINKYNPKYNTKDLYRGGENIYLQEFENLEWIEYDNQ